MQREWTDPRDGTNWLVILTPFGAARPTPTRRTLAFHRPGERPSWTEFRLDLALPELGHQALMDLLDEALRADAVRWATRPARAPGVG